MFEFTMIVNITENNTYDLYVSVLCNSRYKNQTGGDPRKLKKPPHSLLFCIQYILSCLP